MKQPVARVRLTAGRIESFTCPPGKSQAFLWDTDAPALALRVTPTGRRTFVFEARLAGESMRIAIGTVTDWPLGEARKRAQELKRLVDAGIDPREEERKRHQQRAAEAAREAAEELTVRSAWLRYMEEGKPKRRDAWKPRYLADMQRMTAPGGEPKKRGSGLTLPGHITPLLSLRLSQIDEDRLTAWFLTESRRSKHQATRALMMFRGFLRWCSIQPEYRRLVSTEVAKGAAIMDNLPEAKRRTDALEAAQVSSWWTAVEQLPNQVASVYLRALLLTGARREEMAALKWSDVDFRWQKMTIADKVGDTRTFPLTSHLSKLLQGLPRAQDSDGRASPFVFASASKTGRIADPRSSHEKALATAGICGLTLHGLRRSFSLLGEAAGAPAGAIAQVMGHRPSATAEGYRPRSVDALRPYLQRIEDHILQLTNLNQVSASGND